MHLHVDYLALERRTLPGEDLDDTHLRQKLCQRTVIRKNSKSDLKKSDLKKSDLKIGIRWNPLESIGFRWNPLESVGIR